MGTLSSPSLSKLIFNVRNMLNQPVSSNSFWSDAELTEYINEAVRIYFLELCMANEGGFTKTGSLDITSGTETIALPSDFFELRAAYKVESDLRKVLSYDNAVDSSFTTTGGNSPGSYEPSYHFRDNSLVLRPTPNFSETSGILIEYYYFPATLVDGGDALTSVVSPIFKQLIEAYAVFKAKFKESLVNGVNMHSIAEAHLGALYKMFKDNIATRSKYPQYTLAFNPELE